MRAHVDLTAPLGTASSRGAAGAVGRTGRPAARRRGCSCSPGWRRAHAAVPSGHAGHLRLPRPPVTRCAVREVIA